MTSKTSSKFSSWQWALISSCSTLVLAIAFYGIGNLFSPKASSSKPSNTFPFVNQSRKIGQAEAKAYTGALNRGQQAYYTEYERFSDRIDVLGLGIKTDTGNYRYRTYVDSSRKTIKTMNAPQIAIQIGQSKSPELKSYIGAVWLSVIPDSTDVTTLAILCETNARGTSEPPVPIVVGEGMMECASGTKDMYKK
ncbi:type IV pilin-like G/H family protein [Tumidithrix elongata RA019]|uniref:Type IV pilin-like G/H family protein n=1 Tax=Tumidithrix elongata BACA0141 TaxID=2716417 RepID=A0AAW9Q5M7_9CYAN|nr:type IV pilin-like G/H family protein [Tumidithrix elongata RA019]